MSSEFSFRLVTPAGEVVDQRVSEVLLPAFDGEAGVLADHEDFVGLLGTGALKYVQGGNDYWCMVSSGVFEVERGSLTVLTEVSEAGAEVADDSERERLRSLEAELAGLSITDTNYKSVATELARSKARLEAHRRTRVVN